MAEPQGYRILVIDDQEHIHEDFRKILAPAPSGSEALESARSTLFGGTARVCDERTFELDAALQGEPAIESTARARQEERPFALAFVDVRMPPGIDGVQTIKRLWQADPDLHVVICTAYSDYSYEEIFRELGQSHQLLFLKKPFEPVEVRQLAVSLTEKWTIMRRERERLEELRVANEAVQAASRAKSEFLANMSHEIRTPMNLLLGNVELLCDPSTSIEEQVACGEIIRASSEHLLMILNDILDLARIEAARVVVNLAESSPLELTKEVLSPLTTRAGLRGLELLLAVPGPIPEVIETDVVRLRQILLNLVGNAIKFTPRGSVRVVLRLEVTDPSQGRYLCIDVIDTGIGIPADKLEQIFEPFGQLDTSTTRSQGGTGLGLAISRRLARLLGGNLEVHSVPRQGSKFTLRLPVESARSLRQYTAEECRLEGPARSRSPGALPTLSGRILVVEDAELNQRLFAAILHAAGARVDVAPDGDEGMALALAAEEAGDPYDLVLMDMQMPVVDGFEAVRRLRAGGYLRPVLALTGSALPADREECLRAGCDEHEGKPILRERLLASCARLMASPSRVDGRELSQ